jgi:hypothetical protein
VSNISLTRWKKQRLRVYENRVQKLISGPKRARQPRNEKYYIMRRLINPTYFLHGAESFLRS